MPPEVTDFVFDMVSDVPVLEAVQDCTFDQVEPDFFCRVILIVNVAELCDVNFA